MRIAVDVRRLAGPRTGIHRFLSSLLEAAGASSHEWVRIEPRPGVSRTRYLLRDLPREAERRRADVLLAPHVWDFPGRTPLPIVAVAHDDWPVLRPPWGDPHTLRHLLLDPCGRRAAGVAFVSDFTRRAFESRWRRPDLLRAVVGEGVGAPFRPDGPRSVAGASAGGYYLAVVSDDPRKDLPFLARLAPRLPAPLVVAGDVPPERLPGAVLLGQVADEALAALYRGAVALLFPSRYEGFGLPAAEAARCGCPVLAARTASLPEVLGEGHPGLLPPDDLEAWVRAARRLREDPSAAGANRRAGLEATARLDWDVTRRALERLLEEAVGAGRRQTTGAK